MRLAFGLILTLASSAAFAQTTTSTDAIPRAETPEGGTNDGLPRAGQEGGLSTEWREKGTPPGDCHKCKHAKCDHHGAAEVDEHGCEYETSARFGCPRGEACPHGEGCDGCDDNVGMIHQSMYAPETKDSNISVSWNGYLRIIGSMIQNDDLPFVGRNDGFRVADARLGLTARLYNLYAYVSIDASAGEAEEFNDPNAKLRIDLKDAFLEYDFGHLMAMRLGRFKAPYDAAELVSTAGQIFIDRPVATRGVRRTEGIETDSMSQERQLSLMFYRDRLGLSDDAFDLGYAAAVTNGRTRQLVLNDNDRPAGFVRLSGMYSDNVTLNVGGFIDTRTVGELPNRFDEEVLGGEVSLALCMFGLRVEGEFLIQRTRFITTGLPEVLAFGAYAQWAYRIWGFEPAYRFAFYDPNDRFDADRVIEHTIALSYYWEKLPLKFSLNGTLADEAREIKNNRLDALLQYVF